jgi:hypothetical protein
MPSKITLHWTGGTHEPNHIDMRSYHLLVTGAGRTILGDHAPEDNGNVRDGKYARHAGGFNTGNIGVALCGMAGAKESPFEPGPNAINPTQVHAAAKEIAALCETYSIDTDAVYLHSEIRPRFQRGIYKWDVNFMPTLYGDSLAEPIEAGDHFRGLVVAALAKLRGAGARATQTSDDILTAAFWTQDRRLDLADFVLSAVGIDPLEDMPD